MSQSPASPNRAFRMQDLETWSAAIFRKAGLSESGAMTASQMLIRTDARGGRTHGLSRLRSYIEKLSSGEMSANATLKVEGGGGFIRIDANRTLGQVAGPYAIDAAVEITDKVPTTICTLRNTGHLGALGVHVLRAAEAGRVAVMMQSTPPLMSLPGAKGPMLGNNPLAIGAPRSNGAPVVIDIACSVVARGNIILANGAGRAIPEGWALDGEGNPTTNAEKALKGSLLPFGGYKGMMVAALVELLAGSLSGAAHEESLNAGNKIRSAPGGVNAIIAVFNPRLMNGWDEYQSHVAAWTSHYLSAGGSDARIPGEQAFQREKKSRENGIELGDAVLGDLRKLADSSAVPLPHPINV